MRNSSGHQTVQPSLVFSPPFIVERDLGVTAVDLSVADRLPGSDLVAVCSGGHSGSRCLLGGQAGHSLIVAIDQAVPAHRHFAKRLRRVIRAEIPMTVISRKELEDLR